MHCNKTKMCIKNNDMHCDKAKTCVENFGGQKLVARPRYLR